MTKIGFLTFGFWRPADGSQTRSAADALLQTIELAQAAEEIGIDGAFVRVHHWERQLASPFPLLSAIAARTSRIEIGTAVIDMRYENPNYQLYKKLVPSRRTTDCGQAVQTRAFLRPELSALQSVARGHGSVVCVAPMSL